MNGIYVIDISDKENPKFVKKVGGIKGAFKGIVIDNFLYLVDDQFYILSLANPKDLQNNFKGRTFGCLKI